MSRNPFDVAHTRKIRLTQTTANRITRTYTNVYKDLQKELKGLRIVNPSDALRKVYLENFITEAKAAYNEAVLGVKAICIDGAEKAGQIAIDAGNKVIANAGLSIQGAFSYIPHEQVQNIVSGQLYGRNWSLSKSIWGMNAETKSSMEKIVAQGLAKNKPIKDIADALEKYVDPSAKKPWDWNKVYPGTAAKVDYNAQRLARTMIQHSYQSSLARSMRYNPWCNGIIWWSVGLHGRTCAECLDRDGQIFLPAELPLDHPNGLCYFEPAMANMNTIADDIADWATGGENWDIDYYISKGLDLSPKSTQAKQAIEIAKRSYNFKRRQLKTKFTTPEAFVDKNLGTLKKKVLASSSDGEGIWKALRKRLLTLDEDQLKYLATGQDALKGIRYTDGGAFFRPSTKEIHMNMVKDMSNVSKKGEFSTFFHEYGHLLDDVAGFTADEDFVAEAYSLLEKEYRKIPKNRGKIIHEVQMDMIRNDVSAGVQDAISGISLNRNRIMWGHSTSYWKRNKKYQVVSETVANINEAWANPEASIFWRKYFPKSYDYIKNKFIEYTRKRFT